MFRLTPDRTSTKTSHASCDLRAYLIECNVYHQKMTGSFFFFFFWGGGGGKIFGGVLGGVEEFFGGIWKVFGGYVEGMLRVIYPLEFIQNQYIFIHFSYMFFFTFSYVFNPFNLSG